MQRILTYKDIKMGIEENTNKTGKPTCSLENKAELDIVGSPRNYFYKKYLFSQMPVKLN